jgi:hypothetical protein
MEPSAATKADPSRPRAVATRDGTSADSWFTARPLAARQRRSRPKRASPENRCQRGSALPCPGAQEVPITAVEGRSLVLGVGTAEPVAPARYQGGASSLPNRLRATSA